MATWNFGKREEKLFLKSPREHPLSLTSVQAYMASATASSPFHFAPCPKRQRCFTAHNARAARFQEWAGAGASHGAVSHTERDRFDATTSGADLLPGFYFAPAKCTILLEEHVSCVANKRGVVLADNSLEQVPSGRCGNVNDTECFYGSPSNRVVGVPDGDRSDGST